MESGQVYDMNCQEFWDTMPELENGEFDHVQECPACAALLERQRALRQGLRAVAEDWQRIEAPSRLEPRLLSAFRSHNGLPAEWPPRFWIPVLTWVAATAAIVTLASFLIRERRPEPALKRAPHRIELAQAQTGAAGEDSTYGEDNGFIPLPNAERVDPSEDVDLVRVELPRWSMIALGYSVSAERLTEPVEAEVVLGADGLARAVRFLDE